ncbi:MAG TPA: hypothetical protein VGR62_07980 [Candidatus Binatia bacterium]|jgi:exopolyphosphatase/guanosine-5'-triphosphate,3'-diphosphate pyrophosphatase|nr:hypothetical protein [Candidatus Binatia bacterium]
MSGAAGEPAIAAVLDVGSNSVLLLTVVVSASGRLTVRDSALATTRLGSGLVDGGALDPSACARTTAAVVTLAGRARAAGCTQVWAYATGAARRACDGTAFTDALSVQAQCPVEVLTGEREARLAYAAAALGNADDAPLLVVDVGGGTTELTRGRGPTVLEAVSLPLGALALTERHGDDVVGLATTVERTLATTDLPARAFGTTLIASGGTASALAALDLGLDAYDPARIHRHVLDVSRLAALAIDERTAALDPGRARLLPAGATVLAHVAAAVGVGGIVVSELAVRHAYLAERLAADGRAVDLRTPWT